MKIETILRSLFRHRLSSAIIIISLVIGIACMNLIVVFVSREYNVDGFLKNKDRIYMLYGKIPKFKWGTLVPASGTAEYLKANFAGVKDFCRVVDETKFKETTKIITNHHDYFDQPHVLAATSNFFNFLSYKLILGNPQNVLKSKQDIVISQKLARKYFGRSDPIGKKITLVNRSGPEPMFVTGVFKKPLGSSNLNFDMVVQLSKEDVRYKMSQCYVFLAKHANIKQLEQKFIQNQTSIPHQPNIKETYHLKTLRAHYFSNYTGQINRNKTDLAIALLIAFLILGVALFNYLGLTNN